MRNFVLTLLLCSLNLSFILAQDVFSVTVVASAGGSATGGGNYNEGTSITLAANANNGYRFEGWYQGDNLIAVNKTFSLSVKKDITLVAKFTPALYNISVNAGEGGLVTGGGNFKTGDMARVMATPNQGKEFAGWYIDNKLVSKSHSFNFLVEKNVTLIAKFK